MNNPVFDYVEGKYGCKWEGKDMTSNWHIAFAIWNYEVNNKGKEWYDEAIKMVKVE